jgi:hypothetical protein
MAVQIATEKSRGNTTVTVPVHPEFAESLRAACAARIVGTAQMMAVFGWTDPKKPAHYIAKAKRDKLGLSGMDKLESFDKGQSENIDDFTPLRAVNATVTPISSFRKKS